MCVSNFPSFLEKRAIFRARTTSGSAENGLHYQEVSPFLKRGHLSKTEDIWILFDRHRCFDSLYTFLLHFSMLRSLLHTLIFLQFHVWLRPFFFPFFIIFFNFIYLCAFCFWWSQISKISSFQIIRNKNHKIKPSSNPWCTFIITFFVFSILNFYFEFFTEIVFFGLNCYFKLQLLKMKIKTRNKNEMTRISSKQTGE